jgi:predicted amidohydrolase
MKTVRIAAAQYPLTHLPTLGAYRDKLATWVADAAAGGAELLVFPEYGAMEYAGAFGSTAMSLPDSLEAVARVLPEMDATHAELARTHNLHILAASGPSHSQDGRTLNAARFFTPSGTMGVQHKMIMTPFEKDWGVSSGQTVSVFDTVLGRIGIAICYDSEFPLLVRAMAEAGADIILVPSCTEFASGFNRVRTAALARALENGCIAVQSPTVGLAPWSPAVDVNTGAAGIFAPAEHGLTDTGVLASGELNAPGLVFATVDLAHLARVRTSGEMRNNADWRLQPGAASLAGIVKIIDLK